VNIGDHIIPQVTQFKYLRSIVQNDGEIEGNLNHKIHAGWLKLSSASYALYDTKVTFKSKGIFLTDRGKIDDVVRDRVLGGKKPTQK
jgi:hypothetical protein